MAPCVSRSWIVKTMVGSWTHGSFDTKLYKFEVLLENVVYSAKSNGAYNRRLVLKDFRLKITNHNNSRFAWFRAGVEHPVVHCLRQWSFQSQVRLQRGSVGKNDQRSFRSSTSMQINEKLLMIYCNISWPARRCSRRQ